MMQPMEETKTPLTTADIFESEHIVANELGPKLPNEVTLIDAVRQTPAQKKNEYLSWCLTHLPIDDVEAFVREFREHFSLDQLE